MKAELATVHYCMLIKGTTIKVQKYDDELALTPKIEKVFKDLPAVLQNFIPRMLLTNLIPSMSRQVC